MQFQKHDKRSTPYNAKIHEEKTPKRRKVNKISSPDMKNAFPDYVIVPKIRKHEKIHIFIITMKRR